jgi:signal transduction histidine kinase/ActR/RegA family two-component response regulator
MRPVSAAKAVGLDEDQLNLIFPAHIRLGPDLEIVSMGQSLQRLLSSERVGSPLQAVFSIERPKGVVDFHNLVRSRLPLQLRALAGPIYLRGLVLADGDGCLLCVSHVVSDMSAPQASGLRMSDFSEADSSLSAVLSAGIQASMVAESKELMRDLAKARDDALAASHAKSAFLANMSHEIRTPLNGVVGVVGALARTDLLPAQREMVELLLTSGQSLERLLSDILDLSKVEAGQLTLEASPFCLSTAIEDAVELMRLRADEKGLALRFYQGPGADALVLGDVFRVKQVALNLVSNAIKFTSQGRVDVRVTVQDNQDETLAIALEVVDTGIGFDAEARELVFQRFTQADGSITRRFGGSGLGLAISRALAAAMGGEIRFQSEVGTGSHFSLILTLPRVALAVSAAPGATDVPNWMVQGSGGGKPLRILLVEDHPVNRQVVRLILEGQKVELTTANDGQEAIDMFQPHRFDLILMDMQMPVMDGLKAIRLIRDRELADGLVHIPIAMLTANAMQEHRQAAKAAGADTHITKPLTPESLFNGIEATLVAGRLAK